MHELQGRLAAIYLDPSNLMNNITVKPLQHCIYTTSIHRQLVTTGRCKLYNGMGVGQSLLYTNTGVMQEMERSKSFHMHMQKLCLNSDVRGFVGMLSD